MPAVNSNPMQHPCIPVGAIKTKTKNGKSYQLAKIAWPYPRYDDAFDVSRETRDLIRIGSPFSSSVDIDYDKSYMVVRVSQSYEGESKYGRQWVTPVVDDDKCVPVQRVCVEKEDGTVKVRKSMEYVSAEDFERAITLYARDKYRFEQEDELISDLDFEDESDMQKA